MSSNQNRLNNFNEVPIDYSKINKKSILSPQTKRKSRFKFCEKEESSQSIKNAIKRKV